MKSSDNFSDLQMRLYHYKNAHALINNNLNLGNGRYYGGLCALLPEPVTQYPELFTIRLKLRMFKAQFFGCVYWFPLNKYGRRRRVAHLNRAIRKTEKKLRQK